MTNFKFGLVCGLGEDDSRVCEETTTIRVTGDSRCTYNRERRPCTWFGYTFEYDLLTETPALACSWSSTESMNEGNPDGVRAMEARSGTYEIPLPSRRGRFANPQYALLVEGPATRTVMRQTCSYEGREVFAVEYTVLNGTP